MHVCAFCLGSMYCSWDLQLLFLAKTTIKLGLMTLFTHLKIILLQWFQFSAINGIQIDPLYSIINEIVVHIKKKKKRSQSGKSYILYGFEICFFIFKILSMTYLIFCLYVRYWQPWLLLKCSAYLHGLYSPFELFFPLINLFFFWEMKLADILIKKKESHPIQKTLNLMEHPPTRFERLKSFSLVELRRVLPHCLAYEEYECECGVCRVYFFFN